MSSQLGFLYAILIGGVILAGVSTSGLKKLDSGEINGVGGIFIVVVGFVIVMGLLTSLAILLTDVPSLITTLKERL